MHMGMLAVEIILFLLSGVVSGFFAGLLGIGGGTVIVPTLYFMFTYYAHFSKPIVMHMAIGTSLAVVLVNAIISTTAHSKKHNLLWPEFFKMVIGLALGAATASLVASHFSGLMLHVLFVFFLLVSALQVVINKQPAQDKEIKSLTLRAVASYFIGFFAVLLGIGGSVLSIPFFLRIGLPMKRAVALAASCGMPIALVGMIGFMVFASSKFSLPTWSIGYVYVPAVVGIGVGALFGGPLGAKIAIRLPDNVLRSVFFVFLLGVAVSMLIELF